MEVEVVGRRRQPAGGQTGGPPEDQRDLQLVLVEGVAVEHPAVLEQLVAMVRGDDHQRFPRGVAAFDLVQKRPEVEVVVGHRGGVKAADAILVRGVDRPPALLDRQQGLGAGVDRRSVAGAAPAKRPRKGSGGW